MPKKYCTFTVQSFEHYPDQTTFVTFVGHMTGLICKNAWLNECGVDPFQIRKGRKILLPGDPGSEHEVLNAPSHAEIKLL